MEIVEKRGRRVTDSIGAAEYVGLTPGTQRVYAHRRDEYGWPEPVATETVRGGVVRHWYALDDLDAFKQARATAPAPPETIWDGPGHALLSARDIGALAGIKHGTWKVYERDSASAWAKGQDGYLPLPNWDTKVQGPPPEEELADLGLPNHPGPRPSRYWRAEVILPWLAGRTTRDAAGRPGRQGRRSGPVPKVGDLEEALKRLAGRAGHTSPPTNAEIAAELSEHFEREVSVRTVMRLKKHQRDQAGQEQTSAT